MPQLVRVGCLMTPGGVKPTFAEILQSGSVAGWSAGRVFNAAFGGTFADYSGGNCTKIYDQIGSRDATTAGTITQGTSTINGLNYSKLDGVATDKWNFTALALGATGFTIAFAVGVPTSMTNVKSMIGKSDGNQHFDWSSTTNCNVRANTGNDVSYAVANAVVAGVQIFIYRYDGATVFMDINAEKMGSPYGRDFTGKSFTFDQFGATQASTDRSSMGFCECIIWNRYLTDTDATTVFNNMNAAWRSGFWIDAAASDDTGLAWNAATAKKTLATARTPVFRRGALIWIKGGGSFLNDPLYMNASNENGVAGSPVAIKSTDGTYYTISQYTDVGTGSWSAVGGGVYNKTIALTSCQGVDVVISGTESKLVSGAFGSLSAGKWAYQSGTTTLQVFLPGGVAPATVDSILAFEDKLADSSGARFNNDYQEIRNCYSYRNPGRAFYTQGNQLNFIDVKGAFSSDDSWGPSGTGLFLCRAEFSYPGSGSRANTGPGDVVSLHGGASAVITDVYMHDSPKAGIDHQDSCNVDHYRCKVWQCTRPVATAVGTGGGTQRIIYSQLILTQYDIDGGITDCISDGQGGNYVFYNCIIVNTGTKAGSVACQHFTTGTIKFRNCIFQGFESGIHANPSSGTIDSDYNLFFDVTNPYTGGASAGAHDIIGQDPLFTNFSGLNFTLQNGSPAIGAGQIITDLASSIATNAPASELVFQVDYAKAAVPTTTAPNMGCYQ